MIDGSGVVHRANRSFLELVQIASETAVMGSNLGRWLERPGADLSRCFWPRFKSTGMSDHFKRACAANWTRRLM